jgi:hypothetical protein
MGLFTFRHLLTAQGKPRGERPRAGKRAAYGVLAILSTALATVAVKQLPVTIPNVTMA